MNCIGSSHCSFYKEGDTKIKENYLHIKKKLPEDLKEVTNFDVKVFDDDIYNDLVRILNCNTKTKLKFVDILLTNLKSYEIVGKLRCLTTINGNILYMICKTDFERFVTSFDLEDTNLKFTIMTLELTRDFLKNLTIINHQNRQVKVFKSDFVDRWQCQADCVSRKN